MTVIPPDWPNRDASRMVRNGGLEWHVQEAGTGPVLLLIHGTGAATHSWRDVLPLAARHFRVVAIDLPGHGFTSGRAPGGASLPAITRAVGALLAALELAPAMVVGHSAGAAIALRLALDKLVQPRALLAVAPALLPFPGIAQQLFPAMAKLLFVNPFAPHIFAQIARQPGAVATFLKRATGSPIDAAGVAQYARLFSTAAHCAGAITMMADWDLTQIERQLPELATPLLVLHGDRDAAIPLASAREATARVPGAVFEELSGYGHLVHEEVPHVIVERIIALARAHGVMRAEEGTAWTPNTTA